MKDQRTNSRESVSHENDILRNWVQLQKNIDSLDSRVTFPATSYWVRAKRTERRLKHKLWQAYSITAVWRALRRRFRDQDGQIKDYTRYGQIKDYTRFYVCYQLLLSVLEEVLDYMAQTQRKKKKYTPRNIIKKQTNCIAVLSWCHVVRRCDNDLPVWTRLSLNNAIGSLSIHVFGRGKFYPLFPLPLPHPRKRNKGRNMLHV